MDNKTDTIAWQVTDFKSARYIPEVVDEESKRYTGSIDAMLYNSASLLKQIAYDKAKPAYVVKAAVDGYLHTFAEKYDVDGEIAKFESEEPDELKYYEESFKAGFEAGMLTHYSVDVLMRKGLGFNNYQPIVFTKEEL